MPDGFSIQFLQHQVTRNIITPSWMDWMDNNPSQGYPLLGTHEHVTGTKSGTTGPGLPLILTDQRRNALNTTTPPLHWHCAFINARYLSLTGKFVCSAHPISSLPLAVRVTRGVLHPGRGALRGIPSYGLMGMCGLTGYGFQRVLS